MPRGPAYYRQPYGSPGIIFLAEREIQCVKALDIEPRDAYAGRMGLLYGGAIFQTTPALAGAPLDLSPEVFNLEMEGGAAEEQVASILRARALSQRQAVSCWLPIPVEDRWIIPATAKTSWTLSRNFSFSLVALNPVVDRTVPRVFIEETPGDTETRLELTRNATSPPDAGEFYVNPATDGSSFETLDLSGTYAGRVLTLRYYPKRLVRVGPVPLSLREEEFNGLDWTLTLEELIPAREYE